MSRSSKWKKTFQLFLLLLVLIALWVGWQFRLPPAPPRLPANYHPEKAVWLEITWAMDTHSDGEIQALAQNLQKHDISTVFAYVSYLKPNDIFNSTYTYAQNFVEQMHETAPKIRVLAWIGVPIQVTLPNGGYTDNRLTNANTRNLIATFAAQMVNNYGFDGIHLDAEAVSDGDTAYIQTLQAIRAGLPKTATLSTAAHTLQLTERVTFFPLPIVPDQCSADYLREIAQNSDQIALMAYDSGLFFPTDYRAWMEYQVKTSAQALDGIDTDYLIGVPASEEWTLSHNITTEYLANSLYAVQAALAESDSRNNVDGIAIYPHWEIDGSEWALLDQFGS